MKITKQFWLLALLLSTGAVVSCSESDDRASTGEYADWQARNDAYFMTLEDSLSRNPAAWKKLRSYTKSPSSVGANTEYVYAKVLSSSGDISPLFTSDASPLFTDTVRVAYRGRLIPSTNYPQGYVFDQTYVGNFDINTTDVSNNAVSGYIEGFATALQHMRIGDQWRVYIPYQLGYGSTAKNSIPAYSTVIFDLILIDFVTNKDKLDPWSSRALR